MQAQPCKTLKTGSTHTVEYNFGVCMWASEHIQHTRDAHHKLTLGFPHYMCDVATGTVVVGNEIQLFCN